MCRRESASARESSNSRGPPAANTPPWAWAVSPTMVTRDAYTQVEKGLPAELGKRRMDGEFRDRPVFNSSVFAGQTDGVSLLVSGFAEQPVLHMRLSLYGLRTLQPGMQEDKSHCIVPYWIRAGKHHLTTAYPFWVEAAVLAYSDMDKFSYIKLIVSENVMNPLSRTRKFTHLDRWLRPPWLDYYFVTSLYSRENERRDRAAAEERVLNTSIVETVGADGETFTHVVGNNQIDLTDRENLTL